MSRFLIACVLVASGCGRSSNEAAPPAKSQPATAAAARPQWPKESCTILSAQDVGAIVGATVTPRAQFVTCDYLAGVTNSLSVSYYDNKYSGSEYAIFKGLQKGKGTPVDGLGVEAMEGNSGVGAGLAVQLADGRSFIVVDGNKASRLAVAKLVIAKL